MKHGSLARRGPGCLAALLVGLTSQVAEAQVPPACSSLPGNIVYMQIGDTQQPLIKDLGRRLRDSTLDITLVYITSGSCTNVDAFYAGTNLSTNALYIPSTTENAGWTTAMAGLPCTVPSDPQLQPEIDIANSALFVSACRTDAPPAGVRIVRGPNQAYLLVVPEGSRQTAITAEEAYFVFGFGAAGLAEPWTNESLMFIRPNTKSTLLTWAATLLVPKEKWKGMRLEGSNMVLSSVATASDPEAAIGLLGAEIYDGNRGMVNSLAFAAFGQYYAYYADSTPTSFDKKNLRDGHYAVWSPTEWLIRESAGTPVNANAALVVDLILGKERGAGFNSQAIVINKGLVPQCAMKVTRNVEAGPLALYDAPEPCHCFYDSVVATTSCAVCSEASPCATGTCRNGFCEAR